MGLGDLVTSIFGSENKERAPIIQPDANRYAYGGDPLEAELTAARYRQQAEGAQNRQGVQVNYDQANWDRARGLQARGQQQDMYGLMARRAQGRGSIAQMQADRQMQQATAAQASAAASARGPAALALAQQTAAANTANMQGAISNQAQINAAQERLAAEQAAFGAASGMRGGDLASQQQAAQQQQYQAGLHAQQRALNDQMTLGMTGFEHGVRSTALAGNMNYEAQRASNELGAAGINAGVGGQNAGTNQQNAWGVLGMARDAAGAAGSIFGKADGGPIAGQQPYLVGERGPELVIPSQGGMVIPADKTKELLGSGMVDIGGQAGMSAANVLAGARGARGPHGMVGGGGVVGGTNVPGGAGIVALAEGGQMVPSTWGTGGPDVAAQQAAANEAAAQSVVGQQLVRQAETTMTPWERDVKRVQLLRHLNPELVNEEDEQTERRGLARMGLIEKDRAEKKADPKKDAAKSEGAPAAARRSDTLDRMVGLTPAQYQAMGGYVPPSLVALPSVQPRAEGGPMQGADVLPLYEPPGQLLQVGEDGRAYLASAAPARPSIASMTVEASPAQPLAARIPVASSSRARKMTEEEMMREAEKLMAQMRGEHQTRMAAGPAVRGGMAAMKK